MPAGRPSKYTPDDLWIKFEEYKQAQADHVRQVYDAKRKQVMEINYNKPVTLTGFCVFAGMHRDTLNEYKNNRPEYSDTVKSIYAEVEAELLERALIFESHANFTMHLLNNAHGYSIRTTQELTGPGGGPVQLEQLTTAELQDRVQRLLAKAGDDVDVIDVGVEVTD